MYNMYRATTGPVLNPYVVYDRNWKEEKVLETSQLYISLCNIQQMLWKSVITFRNTKIHFDSVMSPTTTAYYLLAKSPEAVY